MGPFVYILIMCHNCPFISTSNQIVQNYFQVLLLSAKQIIVLYIFLPQIQLKIKDFIHFFSRFSSFLFFELQKQLDPINSLSTFLYLLTSYTLQNKHSIHQYLYQYQKIILKIFFLLPSLFVLRKTVGLEHNEYLVWCRHKITCLKNVWSRSGH